MKKLTYRSAGRGAQQLLMHGVVCQAVTIGKRQAIQLDDGNLIETFEAWDEAFKKALATHDGPVDDRKMPTFGPPSHG